MPLYNKIDFAPTYLERDSSVSAAHNELGEANQAIGRAISGIGAKVAQKEVEDHNREVIKTDNKFIAETRISMNNQSKILREEYQFDSEGYKTQMELFNTNLLKDANERTLEQLQLNGYEYVQNGFTDIGLATKQRDDEAAFVAVQEADNILQNQAIAYAVDGDIEKAHNSYDDFVTSKQAQYDSGDIDAATLANGLISMRENLLVQAHEGVVARFIAGTDIEGLNKYIADLKNTKSSLVGYDTLKPEGALFTDGIQGNVREEVREQLITNAQATLKAYNSNVKATDKVAIERSKTTLSSYETEMKNGIIPNEQELQDYFNKCCRVRRC